MSLSTFNKYATWGKWETSNNKLHLPILDKFVKPKIKKSGNMRGSGE